MLGATRSFVEALARTFLALLFCWLSSSLAFAESIRFAPLALEDSKILHEQIGGLVDFLSRQTGLSIQWVSTPDYADLLAAFRAGGIDLAYLGPLPFVILQQDGAQAQSLGCFRDTDGAPSYSCALVALADQRLTPSQIHNKRIGLTQPLSTCGFLAVSEMLQAAGRRLDGDGNRFSYAGSHSQAALGVVRGDYDVAGVKTAIGARYAHLNLEAIAESRRWPGFSLVANTSNLSADQVARLREALAMLEDPDQQPGLNGLTKGWGEQVRHGILPPEACDYTPVAEALSRLRWPIPAPSKADTDPPPVAPEPRAGGAM